MRIISGHHKNRRINFNNLNIRPTTDFAKESLFNILENYYDFNTVYALDLFAGSGNISYEFVSRGAIKTIAIDQNIKYVNFKKKTKEKIEMKNFEIICSKAIRYIKKTENKFDIIFIDPPYKYIMEEYEELILHIFKKNILNMNGTVVIEHSKFINFINYSSFLFKKKYGSVHFSFLKNEK